MNIETAGARLKKIRQERGLSLEDVQKKTKIHLNVLRAIEGDSISNLSPIYLKGFIKIYCGYLGLECKDFVGVNPPPPAKQAPLNATVGRPLGSRIEKKTTTFIKEAAVKINAIKPLVNFKKIAAWAGVFLVFFFLLTGISKCAASHSKKKRLEKARISMPASTPKPAVQAATASAAKSATRDISTGFTLGIFAKSKSWITAKVDGKVVFRGVLARGRSETWAAKEKAELSLGDAAAVELQVNDQRFANLGRRGESLKNVLINKEGLKISR